ncbi:VIR protein [Plasmodium vivax]|uniref:VIR protein n=1 Tax=Plasmodium vivax TaxID=5855 RepID=A0A1G4EIE5_PLAVI|nr:VIR protein [Plasmodium vivax]
MGCDPTISDESYKFFEDIDGYIEKSNAVENTDIDPEYFSACTSFSKNWETKLKNKETAKRICGKYIKLYESLYYLKNNLKTHSNYKIDCRFLNYWINSKLNNKVIDDNICVSTFYITLESHCSENFQHVLSSCEMYNINKDELDKITILYNLHNKRNEINTIINSQRDLERSKLNELSSECSTKYKKGLAMCHNKDDKFCELLENFKKKYEELYPTVETKGHDYSKYFKRLSGYENSNIISTAVTGSIVGLIPLMGILYKYTPMGQLLKPNKGKVTDGQIYNGNDKRNISLMDQESEESTFHQGTYNIKYQSA